MPDGHSQTIARLIRLHETDNVAIVANDRGPPPGSVTADGLTLTERIPLGHKVALADIAQGAGIRRYGTVIGTALEPIPRGAWVSEARVQMPDRRIWRRCRVHSVSPIRCRSWKGTALKAFA